MTLPAPTVHGYVIAVRQAGSAPMRRARQEGRLSENPQSEDVDLSPLREWGDEEFVGKMIDLFLRDSQELMRSARRAEAERDLVSLAHAMHTLSASAGFVGAVRLQDVAAKIVRIARGGANDSLPTLLTDLEHAYAPVKELLEAERSVLDSNPSPSGGTGGHDASGG